MANRVFQNVVYQMKDAIDRVVGVVDETGAVIACSELGQIGEMREGFAVARLTAGDAFEKDGYAYHQFSNAKHNDYAVFVEGNDPTAAQFASLLSISLQSIKQYHDEKFDKTNFIKNVVLDNILPGDIYAKARELHFVSDVQRVVLLIRVTSGNDISAYDVVSSLFPDKQKDFVFNISETDTVLVKEIRPDNNTRDMEKLAASIVDTLQGEHYIKAVVGIGTPISNIKDLASSFKEAQIAMEVGKVFDTEKQVISYDHLGIARLIYQLPTTLCEAFLREVFKQDSIDSLDNTAANTSTGSGSESDSKGGLSISINNDEAGVASEVRALLLLTIIAVSPSLLIMLTSYTRIVIVLHFLRTAIGTQTAPPNQILIGLALFLTFFIMWPTFQQINENAIQPLDNGDITIEEALKEAEVPIRQFMYGQVQRKDVKLFVDMAGDRYDIDSAALEKEYEESGQSAYDAIPMTIMIPSFVIGELRQAFIMGFVIYIPFIVIDMVVASVLMSMGMMMLPPTTISLPFKILLFILADGWNLVIGSVVKTFY